MAPSTLTDEEELAIDGEVEQLVVESRGRVIMVFVIVGVFLGLILGSRGWWFLGGGLVATIMLNKLASGWYK